jgi:hypothetical protein
MKSQYFLVVLIGLALPAIGHAENDIVGQCMSETVDLDVKIENCTAIIDWSHETKEHLSVAYNNRGVAYVRKGQFKQAISDYNDAIRNDPHNPAAFNNRADIYSKANEYQRAIADLDEAIQLKPDYAVAFYNRSVDKQAAGDSAGADADLAAALKFGLDGASGLPWHFFRDPQHKFFVQLPAEAQKPEKTMRGMAIYLAKGDDQLFEIMALDVPNAPLKPDSNYFDKHFADFARNHRKQIHSESTFTFRGYPAAEAEMTDRAIGADYLVDVIVIPKERVYVFFSGGRPGHARSPEARYFRNSFSFFDAPPMIKLQPDRQQTSSPLAVQPNDIQRDVQGGLDALKNIYRLPDSSGKCLTCEELLKEHPK